MKAILPLSLLALLLLTGCYMFRYDVTLTNGNHVTSTSRPKLDARGYYVFKDTSGREMRVHQAQVRAIEPHEEKAEKDQFRPRSQ